MKITGYKLREALKIWQLRRETASRSFPGTLKVFPGESKDAPESVIQQFLKAEAAIVSLEVAQARYNLQVKVSLPMSDGFNRQLPLSYAIKGIGPITRAEKMWRTATGTVPDRYGYSRDDERDPTKEHAKHVVSAADATRLATEQAKIAGKYREAIATGNAVEIDIEDLDPGLFE